MSSVGDAGTCLGRGLDSAARASGALRVGVDALDRMAVLLAEALDGVDHPAAQDAVAGTALAVDILLEVGDLISMGDESVRQYATDVLGVELGGSADRSPVRVGAPVRGVGIARDDHGLTIPSRVPDPAAMPGGVPEEVSPRANAVFQESVRYQNEAARWLATAGYRIRQLSIVHGRPSPDYEIEGRTFDCYTPMADTTPDAIRKSLGDKVKQGQAERFIVNLDRSSVSADDVGQCLARRSPRRLQEVLVLKRGVIVRVWP